MNHQHLQVLSQKLKGELHYDTTMRTLYATDASAYRELPLAVAIPQDDDDLKTLINFAREHHTALIPRTAGTSLAGQVVGSGIVVDVSRHFNKILEINPEERWVRVQPGVVRDELNMALKPYQLYFGPETSTANRAMIGGMVGNNSCGSNSVVYGSTREHLLEVKTLLSDGSEAVFAKMTKEELTKKANETSLEGEIYRKTIALLSDPQNQSEIREHFPKKSVERRNTGYALDLLLASLESDTFNLCQLIAGSEGTLCFLTEVKLNLVPPPPKSQGLVCAHFENIDAALHATIIALQYKPQAVELIDNYVLECAAENVEQRKNAFFVQKKEDGSYPIILVVDVSQDTPEVVENVAAKLIADFKSRNMGYHYPLLEGDDTKKIWTLRKAGLGLLGNLPGDEKAVAVIEDTAVDVHDQPAYIRDFNEILHRHGMSAVHYAHAGSGELHLRPIINLKTSEGHRQFRMIAEEIAHLVKKYKGSLSGEHGDGRLRGEFIPLMVGEKNYQLFKEIKRLWDPQNIFNPGKIVDTPPMDTFLRYEPDHPAPSVKTYFRYPNQTLLQHTEQCNGSGDCRKSHLSGGTMCPSYMATRNEKDTTRARANILREFWTNPPVNGNTPQAIGLKEAYQVLDLCLACKGCKNECPSNVDMAKLKMEFLQQHHDAHGVPLRSWLVGNFARMTQIASVLPWGYNFIFKNTSLRRIANRMVGFHPDRTMPLLHKTTLKQWFEKREALQLPKEKFVKSIPPLEVRGKVYFFCDEFTNYHDVEIGQKAIEVLEKLGYEVIIPSHLPSGRPQLSKGLLREAQKLANQNVTLLKDLITDTTPLVGIEPSAILTFRDEYPDLVNKHLIEDARKIARNALMIDEFIAREIDAKCLPASILAEGSRQKNNDNPQDSTLKTQDRKAASSKLIKLHGHCQQKAIGSLVPTKKMLSLIPNTTVQIIPSGCCGMAGSFGYEKEHYELSMKIGELVLFPTVRRQPQEVIIAASGTSCRHQIHDGTGRRALHPIEILWEALAKN
ncbi:MAG: FAD-binding and (Fe-S)-binding domain-containing protein [Runella sp.]